jgi:hypothetical protein
MEDSSRSFKGERLWLSSLESLLVANASAAKRRALRIHCGLQTFPPLAIRARIH